MTDRKTLGLRDTSDSTEPPALKKRGRGWEISEKRLDALHDRARKLRRHASEAHKVLAKRFAEADMGRYTFKRFAVVGSAIVDFNCHPLGMAIIIEEEGEDEALSKRRDKSLESVGIRVMRIKAEDILNDIDPVLRRITMGMRMRIGDKREAQREHRRNSMPGQTQTHHAETDAATESPTPEPVDSGTPEQTPDNPQGDEDITNETE